MEAGIHFGETRCRNYTLPSMAGGRIGDATELPISMTSSFSWFYRIKTSTRIETTNKKLPVGAEHVLDLHAMQNEVLRSSCFKAGIDFPPGCHLTPLA